MQVQVQIYDYSNLSYVVPPRLNRYPLARWHAPLRELVAIVVTTTRSRLGLRGQLTPYLCLPAAVLLGSETERRTVEKATQGRQRPGRHSASSVESSRIARRSNQNREPSRLGNREAGVVCILQRLGAKGSFGWRRRYLDFHITQTALLIGYM